MMNTYERPFEFEICSGDLPEANDEDKSVADIWRAENRIHAGGSAEMPQ